MGAECCIFLKILSAPNVLIKGAKGTFFVKPSTKEREWSATRDLLFEGGAR